MPLPFRAAAAAALLVAAWPGTQAAEPTTQRSAFEGYRRFADEPVADWRTANDRVGRIGGWQAYAREAAAAARPAPAASPASAPGAGHDAHHPGQGR
jgi:hypothetical protein